MSYDHKRVNEVMWDEGDDGEALTIWMDKEPTNTFTLPSVRYKPGVTAAWVEQEFTVALHLTAFLPHPEGGVRQVSIVEQLAKGYLDMPAAGTPQDMVEQFIGIVTRKFEEFQRTVWLRVEWPEVPDVEQG